MRRIEQAPYGRREIEIAEQEMPGIMALRNKAKGWIHQSSLADLNVSLGRIITILTGYATEFWTNLPKSDLNPYANRPNLTNKTSKGRQAPHRRQDRRLLPHQRPDRRAHRDSHRPRRAGKKTDDGSGCLGLNGFLLESLCSCAPKRQHLELLARRILFSVEQKEPRN